MANLVAVQAIVRQYDLAERLKDIVNATMEPDDARRFFAHIKNADDFTTTLWKEILRVQDVLKKTEKHV